MTKNGGLEKPLFFIIISTIAFAAINSIAFADSNNNQLQELGGIWFWAEPGSELGSSQTLTNPKLRQTAIDFLRSNNFKRLYGEYQELSIKTLADWNSLLYENKIESQLLLAESYWIFPHHRYEMIEKIETDLIDFNNSVENDTQKFKAVHLNLEPHALDIWKQGNSRKKRVLLEHLQNTVSELKEFISKYSPETKIIVDLPVWYDDLNTDIAWKSVADRNDWFARLDENVDGIVLLSYGRDYSATIINTSWELDNLGSVISIALDADIGENGYWKSRLDFLNIVEQLSSYFKGIVSIDIHSFLSFHK